MRLVYCGKATVDEQLRMRKADETFIKFNRQNAVGSIQKFIYEGDYEILRSMVMGIVEGKGKRSMCLVRMQVDSGAKPYLAEGKQEIFKNSDTVAIHVDFYCVEEDSPLSGEDSFRDREAYEAFFGMLSGIMLLYDHEEGVLNVQAGVAEQTVCLYSGTLDEWEHEFMPERLKADSRKEFTDFCAKLRQGHPSPRCSICTDAFGRQGDRKPYQIRCRRLQQGASFRMVGAVFTEKTAAENDVGGFEMDSGLPVLNKKSIVEYAKRVFWTNKGTTYLVIMDLDNFKIVNDTYGHMFGDEVLLRMVQIVKNAVGRMGTLGRIGGDEMLLVLTEIESDVELRNVLRSVRTDIELSFRGEKEGLHLTCSMGVAAYPDHADSYDHAFRLADRMLYLAKQKGKNRYIIYTPEIHDAPVAMTQNEWDKEVSALKEDKPGVMQRLVEKFLIRRVVTLEAELREIAACFELDIITMVYDGGVSTVNLKQNEFTYEPDEYTYREYEEGFLKGFDGENVFAVNGNFTLEVIAPKLCELLKSQEIELALYYKLMHGGDMFGYVMFAKKSRRRLWSEEERIMLSLVGKVLELSLTGK